MTKDEAIRIIKIVLAVAEDFEITVQGEEFTEEKCKEAVEIVTKALEQDQWIPVSERYPEEEGEEYLVCYDDGTIRIRNLYFTVVDNEPYFEYGQGIVAWMPLPEPYKESPTGAEGSEE